MENRKAWLEERLQSILLATDLHQNSRLALNYAADLSRRFDSKLTALYVFEFGPHSANVELLDHLPSRERKEAEELLATFVRESGVLGVIPRVVEDESFVTTAILKSLIATSSGLLVIGTEGIQDGIDHFMLGSNTEALMLGSRCLTMTVGPRVPPITNEAVAFKKVIYISDLSVASIAAATYAVAFGQTFGVPTDLYQITSNAAREEPLRLEKVAAHYSDILRFVDPALPSEWFDPEFHLSRVVSEEELVAISTQSSNLIVLGVQPASFLQRHLRTSLAYKLVATAASPVLTVPAGSAEGFRGRPLP